MTDLDYYVLHAQHPEGNTIEVVHRPTGWRAVLDAVPRVAPGRGYVATASWGVYNENALSIYRVLQDTLQLEWELEPDDWAPERAIWTDSLSLKLIRRYIVFCERDSASNVWETFRDTAEVWRGERGWEYALPSSQVFVDSMEGRYPGSSCRPAYPD